MRHRNDACHTPSFSWILSAILAALCLLPVIACSSSTSTPPPPPPPTGATNFVYTANAGGAPSTVSALISNATSGALTSIAGSSFPAGSGSVAVVADPGGKFLYVANYFSGDISVFTINQTSGALAALSTSPFAAELGVNALAIDPTGKFL
jgi:6-phosphogluconolactonase